MEDLKKQESAVDSTELTGEQLDAVSGGDLLEYTSVQGLTNVFCPACTTDDAIGAIASVGAAIVSTVKNL